MDKPLACFEISSRSVKLVVGYEMDSNPIVLYTKELPIDGMIIDGRIVDRGALISVLKQFKSIDDKEKKIRLNISEAYLVLPSFGLAVYQNNKFTNVVSEENIITKTDIGNVVSLINKEDVPNGNAIVDIIPDEYVLEDGRKFKEAPLNEKSRSLTVKAKVHALPADIISSYVGVMNDAGFRIRKSAVASYCYAELYSKYQNLPKTFILLDIGARISTLTFIGDGCAYASTFFTKGGEDITDRIADEFNVSQDEARLIKESNGFSNRNRLYNPPIYQGTDRVGIPTKFYQSDLNKIISDYVDDYLTMLKTSIKSLLAPYGNKFDSIPFALTGGASKLLGVKDFLESNLGGREIIFIQNRSVGATSPSYSGLLGLICIASRYRGSLVDNQHGVRNVSRVGTAKTESSQEEI